MVTVNLVGLSGASMFSQSLGGVSRAKYLKRLWWEERFNPRMDMKPEWAVDGRVEAYKMGSPEGCLWWAWLLPGCLSQHMLRSPWYSAHGDGQEKARVKPNWAKPVLPALSSSFKHGHSRENFDSQLFSRASLFPPRL